MQPCDFHFLLLAKSMCGSTSSHAHKELRKRDIRNDVAQNATHKGPLTSQEIWDGIRYLDPDVRRFRIAALLFAVVLVCVVALALHLS